MHISLHIEHTITLDFFNSFFSGFFSSSISDTKILIVFSFPLVKSFTDNSLLIILPPYKKYILLISNSVFEIYLSIISFIVSDLLHCIEVKEPLYVNLASTTIISKNFQYFVYLTILTIFIKYF